MENLGEWISTQYNTINKKNLTRTLPRIAGDGTIIASMDIIDEIRTSGKASVRGCAMIFFKEDGSWSGSMRDINLEGDKKTPGMIFFPDRTALVGEFFIDWSSASSGRSDGFWPVGASWRLFPRVFKINDRMVIPGKKKSPKINASIEVCQNYVMNRNISLITRKNSTNVTNPIDDDDISLDEKIMTWRQILVKEAADYLADGAGAAGVSHEWEMKIDINAEKHKEIEESLCAVMFAIDGASISIGSNHVRTWNVEDGEMSLHSITGTTSKRFISLSTRFGSWTMGNNQGIISPDKTWMHRMSNHL